MRAYKQFYIAFRVDVPVRDSDKRRLMGMMAAITINSMDESLLLVEHRAKINAVEYRILTITGIEVKIGFEFSWRDDPNAWIHVSCPKEHHSEPEAIATAIYESMEHHAEISQYIREEEARRSGDEETCSG